MNLKDEYIKLVTNKIGICKDDLNEVELEIIDFSFDLIKEKIEKISDLEKDVYNKNVRIKNLEITLEDIIEDNKSLDKH